MNEGGRREEVFVRYKQAQADATRLFTAIEQLRLMSTGTEETDAIREKLHRLEEDAGYFCVEKDRLSDAVEKYVQLGIVAEAHQPMKKTRYDICCGEMEASLNNETVKLIDGITHIMNKDGTYKKIKFCPYCGWEL